MTREVRGSTRVAAIIGDPVAHSRSPAIHNAAFAELGLDWVFVAFPGDTRDKFRNFTWRDVWDHIRES